MTRTGSPQSRQEPPLPRDGHTPVGHDNGSAQGPDPCELDRLRRQAAVALARNVVALQDLQAELARHADVSETMIGTLSDSDSLLDTFEAVKSHEVRPALTNAIRNFERTRHRARIRLTAVAFAEGASDEDVRKIWSISREMIRRAKRELAELVDEPEEPLSAEA